ncbi:MAG: response regulator [Deltaproteobacteria bacterium]|nr:response regulator [Deltaproteobacteria bacterium]
MTPGVQAVLVVDDEEPFLQTVRDGLKPLTSIEILTAKSGHEAQSILFERRIDLVVTDLKMADGDGFELLAAMSRNHPDVAVLVMTAFATPEIETRLRSLGVGEYLEKPLEFHALASRIQKTLRDSASGAIKGITLPSFLQIVQLDRKSCRLRVLSNDQEGTLRFERGELIDALTGQLKAEEAALEILSWDDARIEILPHKRGGTPTVQVGLTALLMEAIRQKDERQRTLGSEPNGSESGIENQNEDIEPAAEAESAVEERNDPSPVEGSSEIQHVERDLAARRRRRDKETMAMAAKDKLQELANLDGFQGAGVFTPQGEDLAILPGTVQNIREVGVLANNVLMNAQKASLEMGAGRGQVVHIEGEKAHILVRCMNEGTDPLKSQPGRAHIHTVLVLKPDSSIGMAKLRLSGVVEKLAEDFR